MKASHWPMGQSFRCQVGGKGGDALCESNGHLGTYHAGRCGDVSHLPGPERTDGWKLMVPLVG